MLNRATAAGRNEKQDRVSYEKRVECDERVRPVKIWHQMVARHGQVLIHQFGFPHGTGSENILRPLVVFFLRTRQGLLILNLPVFDAQPQVWG